MFQHLIRGRRATAAFFLLFTSISLAFSQGNSVVFLGAGAETLRSNSTNAGTPPDPATVVSNFVVAEAKIREALNQHTFRRDVVLQTIGPNGEVTGEYIRNSQFVFDDRGRRIEKVLYRPKSTIREMRITKEDIQDLAGSQLLGIDITETSKYVLTFTGVENIESRELFAIDVRPVTQPDPHRMKDRYFVGRVWIDPANYHIVKIRGIVEPQGKQRFPLFETWREPILGGLSFPTRTEADDVLHFPKSDVHYRIKVRYYDYKLFASKVSITEIDVPDSNPVSPGKTSSPSKPQNTSPETTPVTPKTTSPDPKQDSSNSSIKHDSHKAEACTANRNAPPIGLYHWPVDTQVKVFFVYGMFTPEQRTVLLDAMGTWTSANAENGSGVTFVDAGETASRQPCQGCLTISRKDVYKRDKRHYAFFHPMNREGDRLVSAWIDLDFAITNLKALKGFAVHELGHGLGLWDCTDCKKKHTIMNGFPGINKDNGLVVPSRCDIATVKEVYYQERQIALASRKEAKGPGPVVIAANLPAPNSPTERLNGTRFNLEQLIFWPATYDAGPARATPVAQNLSANTRPSMALETSPFTFLSLRSPHVDRSPVFWSPSFAGAESPR